MLQTEIAIWACDGVRSCALTEMLDRGTCEWTVLGPTRAYIRSFTVSPSIYFDPDPDVGCDVVTLARFIRTNETDASSVDSPHGRAVHRTDWVLDDNKCVMRDPPNTDGLLGVLDIAGDAVRFARFNATLPQSEIVSIRGSWIDPYVELVMELDRVFTFPACCALPMNFTDTESRIWRQAAYEATCDIVDSAEYVYQGIRPTITAAHNASHDTWRFEIDVDLCSSRIGSVSVDVYVPGNTTEGVVEAPTPRWLLQSETVPQDPSVLIVLIVTVAFLLTGLLVSKDEWIRILQSATKPEKKRKR